jgi:hypothetical protein
MAVVILGGLLTSMALNLLVLPTLALRYGRFAAVRDELGPEPLPAARPSPRASDADRRGELVKVLAHVVEDAEGEQRPRL